MNAEYEENTWYWISCHGGWWSALFNVDGKFCIGGDFIDPSVFENNTIVKAVMPD